MTAKECLQPGDAGFRAELRTCRIAGFDIVTASRAELASAMVSDCLAARACRPRVAPRLVFDANGHSLSLRETDPVYRQAVDQGDIIHADGGFLVTISRHLTGNPIAERSATTDLIHDLARSAAAHGLSFYLLGGPEPVNAECSRRLASRYPGLAIAGRRNGYFPEGEEEGVIEEINRARPDVLWVGMGKPRQEVFSVKWRGRLHAGWVVTSGGCYHYIAGDYPRAPPWMQQGNLEWLHRMATRPRKLLWRYLITNPHALWLAMTRARG